jgi:hypothetical protein
MSPRDLSSGPDLDDLVLAARADLAEATAGDLRDIRPDFAAVVEAAHARDPQRVTRAALDEALALAPVLTLASESSQRLSARGHAEFAAVLVEARAEVDAEVAALRRAGFPPVPVPKAIPVAAPRRRWLWMTAAAAALLLAVASPMLATRFEAERATPSQAPWWQRAGDGSRDATWRELPAPEPARTLPRERPVVEPAEVEAVADIEAVEAVEPVEAPEPAAQPVPKTRKPRDTVEPLQDRLRRLGAEAEQAWQAGDYAGAERRHREIVQLAPGSRAADLSYGDLFTLARQRSGPEQEKLLWREYLAAFPHGRYADDARAGLCRRSAADERADCWQRYLADFPTGVHRSQAERALADATP